MIIQEDTIFVSGMNPLTTEEEISNHFGAIGIIKVNLNFWTFIQILLSTEVDHDIFN